MSRFRRILALLALLSQVVAGTSPAWACTGITIKTKGDNAVVFARTLEFADDIMSNLIIVPRGKEYVGTTPTDQPGQALGARMEDEVRLRRYQCFRHADHRGWPE